MSEWKDLRLGDITKVITKGTTPSNIGADFTESGIKYIRSEMLKQSKHLSNDGFLYISEDTHSRLRRSQLQCNDILFSMAGAYLGKTAILRDCDVPSNTNQAVAIIRVNEAVADADFVYYYLNLPTTTKLVNSISSQSAQPNINLTQIGDLITPMPNLPTQRRIAAILSSLDAKIENNNKVNAKLEEIAQNLFKEWFVDFGPFKDGKFVDSELGPIPEGWRVGTLEETCVEILRGYTPNYVNSSKYKILNQKVNKGSTLDKQYYKYNDENDRGFLSKLAQKGDVLINSLGQGTLGRIHLYTQNTTDVIIDQFITFLRTNIFSKSAYLAFYLSSMSGQAEIMSRITGSTGMWVLTINNIKKIKLVIPPDSIFEKLNDMICNLYDRIATNSEENEKLVTLRDTLLPKLMSGEIEV